MSEAGLAELADPASEAMTPAQRAEFLHTRAHGLFTTRRASGRPFTVPLGFLFTHDRFDESTPVYLSVGGRGSILRRLAGDNRIGMTVISAGAPLRVIAALGVATEVPDPGDVLSLQMLRTGMPLMNSLPSGQLDLGKFAVSWLGAGRSVVRIDFHDIATWVSAAA